MALLYFINPPITFLFKINCVNPLILMQEEFRQRNSFRINGLKGQVVSATIKSLVFGTNKNDKKSTLKYDD